MKNETTADKFKVGDTVWCLVYGEGMVTTVYTSEYSKYPIKVEFGQRTENYTLDGRLLINGNRTLFFSEPKIEASVTSPFVSKLVGKKVAVNTKYGLCVIGVVEIEDLEYLTIDDYHYAKNELKAIYEITSENILEK